MRCVIYAKRGDPASPERLRPYDPASRRFCMSEATAPTYTEEKADAIVQLLTDNGFHAMAKEVSE